MDKKLIKRDVSLRFVAASQYLILRYNITSESLFAKKLEIHPQVFSDIKKGKLFVGIDLISVLLSKFENINTEWIFTGKGDLLKYQTAKQRDVINKFYESIKNDPQLDKASIKNILADIIDEPLGESNLLKEGVAEPMEAYLEIKKPAGGTTKGIPLVTPEALGGFGNMEFAIREQDIQSLYEIPDFINTDFMIRVKGSSMYPKYNSGDVVACRIIKESTFIQWNKVHVVATTEQGILIKRLKKSKMKECFLAVSDNKDYEPFDIPQSEITGIALVVGVVRLE